MTRWGKAGERLTPDDAEKRDRARAATRNQDAAAKARRLEEAHRDWKAGKVVPARITTALDLRSLYGPEVDIACGTVEPAVDEWEAGTRYPTWEQLLALAELTGMSPAYFTRPGPDVDTVMFICARGSRGGSRVVEFTTGPLQATWEARQAVLGHLGGTE
jgi:hypothetical protein